VKLALPIWRKNPYLISLGLHGLLLLIFALVSFNVKPPTQWHQFDLMLDPPPKGAPSSAAGASSGKPKAATKIAKPAESVPELAHSLQDIESPLLDSPVQTKPKIETKPRRETPLSPAANTVGNTGAAGFSFSLIEGDSDAYFIYETKPQIRPLENDVVVVEFSLSADGRIKMNDLKVERYNSGAHWEALQQEMRSWRFGFTGAYNPEKRYRIRCDFRLR
jgi:hypothetical protein